MRRRIQQCFLQSLYCVVFGAVAIGLPLASFPLVGASSEVNTDNHRHRQLEDRLDYLQKPDLNWMHQLQNDESLKEGNVVVRSPFDVNVLYVTVESGKLLALSANDGNVLASISPKPRSQFESGKTYTWKTFCSSGVAFGELDTGKKFLVYTIVDLPPEEDSLLSNLYGPKSRAIAVSIPEHEVLWSSAGLPGTSKGSPIIYQTRGEYNNSYVMLIHNTELAKPDNSTTIAGIVSLLNTTKGNIVWTESEWSQEDNPRGYGPPGLASKPLLGKYAGGIDNKNDLVVWASNDQDGRGQLGQIYAFQMPESFEFSDREVTDLTTTILKKVRWNVATRPIFSRNGTNMYFGVSGSSVRGWVGNTYFDGTADWALDMANAQNDPNAAVPSAPGLSYDETRLFVATANKDVQCVNARNGRSMWGITGTSPFLAEPRVSPDNRRVYLIQSVDGRIFSHDQVTGELAWITSCDQFQEDCANSVLANFDLSRSGQYLYYGDVKGKIISLDLANLVSTKDLDGIPSLDDHKGWGEVQNEKKGRKSKSGSVAGGIGVVFFALLVAMATAFYILLMYRFKNNARIQEEDLSRYDNPTDDYALPNNLTNAPDPYEDSMISKHKARRKLPTSLDASYEDGTFKGSFSDDGFNENISQGPADRLSLLFGTSNRVAPAKESPLKEDFSYGAAVLV